MLCCGSEVLHEELKARAVCELGIHSDFYLSDDKLSITDPDGSTPIKTYWEEYFGILFPQL